MRAALAPAAAAALLLAAAACGAADWRVVQLYGGQGSLELLAEPERVEAFEVEPQPSRPPEPGHAGWIGEHRVVSGPVLLDAAAAAELGSVLRDAGTYDWLRAKSDAFRPTVGLRFRKAVSKLEMVLDFDSDMLLAYRHGQRVGVEDFDAASERLHALLAPRLDAAPPTGR